jgi:hypothetical protein
MKLFVRLFTAFCLGLVLFILTPSASAQIKALDPQITFDSFTGVYHLSRDNKSLSLLTAEETILADFPGNGSFYGIKRVLPKTYQNHAINTKILNVTDAAGNTVPYKITTDADSNLVLTTGDPAITLYGSQTVKIRYQTTGVINLKQKTNEFLLNVNGRGWDQGFPQVNATLYVPKIFQASILGKPTCYTVLNLSKNTNNCQITTHKGPETSVFTSKATNLGAHQALVMKLNFAPSTFTNEHSFWSKNKITVSAIALMFAATFSSYLYLRKR